ncbi:hypothetical protein DID88_008802 [Monilinia fructigena]|uniref:Uncharacterized protein n=1 Tax=Monilinia fructigena TaxID=38457 RepID=A0A395J7I2_9HELO|nr:hypothetical protein DID88_008802 [Monilinia fructigena]
MPLPKAQKLSNEGLEKKDSTAKSCKRPAPKDRDKNGVIIGSETSIASRKRRCPRVTMASLQIDDENDDLGQFTTSFGADSHSHNTWGLPVSTAIVATKRKLLDTLAIVMSPQQGQLSYTALGLEAAPITFADFLWEDGEVFAAIMKLGCKNLKVVMKKDDGMRIMLEVAVNRIFTTSDDQNNWLKNDMPYQQAREDLKKKVKIELAALKDKFEQIFNDERVVKMGCCRVMGRDERLVKDQRRQSNSKMSAKSLKSRFGSECSSV